MANAGSTRPPRAPGNESPDDVLSPTDRDRILQAMADCCAERGYGETAVAEVIERAGVRREAFDSHFADKEDCALAALNKISSETLTTLSTTSSPGGAGAEEIAFGVGAVLALMAANPSFARLAYIEARQAGTPRMREAYDSATKVLALMVERAFELEPATPRPARAGRAMLGGAEAVARREIAAGRGARLPRLLPVFVYAALMPLVGQENALRQSQRAKELIAEEG